MKKIYLVKYYGGQYEDYHTRELFVTSDKETADNYIIKFNSILNKWKNHYSQYCNSKFGLSFIKDEYRHHFNRWYQLDSIEECFYIEIPVR